MSEDMPKYIKLEDAIACVKYGTGVEWEIVSDLKKIPAADVRKVKEAKWVKAVGGWFTPGGDPVWECSICGKGRHVYGVEHGSYGSDVSDGQWVACPNCGAKMDGGQDDGI